jgi:hypothetical protein
LGILPLFSAAEAFSTLAAASIPARLELRDERGRLKKVYLVVAAGRSLLRSHAAVRQVRSTPDVVSICGGAGKR